MTLARAARRRRNVFTRIMDSVPGKGFAKGRGKYYDSCAERKKERKKENKMMQFKWECDYGISYK